MSAITAKINAGVVVRIVLPTGLVQDAASPEDGARLLLSAADAASEEQTRCLQAILELLECTLEDFNSSRRQDGEEKMVGKLARALERRIDAVVSEAKSRYLQNLLRPDVLQFARAIEAKLREIDPDESWKKDLPETLYDLLLGAVGAITQTIDSPLVTDEDGRPIPLTKDGRDQVLGSTAHLAARAFMVADTCGALAEKEPDDEQQA